MEADMKNKDKFWAFLALLVLIAVITLPSLVRHIDQTQLSLADKVITGLVGVLGTVAGALFQSGRDRIDSTNAETTRVLAEAAATSVPSTAIPADLVVPPPSGQTGVPAGDPQ